MKYWLLLGLLPIVIQPAAHAVLPVVDVDGFYFSDSFTYSSKTSSYSHTFLDVMVGLPFVSKGAWTIGWNYDSMSFRDNPGVANTLAITDMGPKVVYTLNKARTASLGVTYNLITRANYNSGTATTQLRGTSLRVELGYLPEVAEGTFIGLKLNYYRASFNEEVVNSNTLNKPSDSRSALYPSIAFTYRFD